MAGNIWEDLGLGKSVDQPEADHLHDDKTVWLFTEFIKRAIRDIDAGKSLDIQEQQRLVNVDTFETLLKLSYNKPLIKYLQIPDEVIEDIPNKLDELLDACAYGKQDIDKKKAAELSDELGVEIERAKHKRVTPKQPNLLNKPLKGLFTYLTEKKYSVDAQVKYVMQVYADCEYMDYHKIDMNLLNAKDSYFEENLNKRNDEKSLDIDAKYNDDDEYVDYRNKYEALRQIRTKLLS